MTVPRGDIQAQYLVLFVCPSVHSLALMSSVRMTKYVVMILHVIIIIQTMKNSDRITLDRGFETDSARKFRDCRLIYRCVLETIRNKDIITVKKILILNYYDVSNPVKSDDAERAIFSVAMTRLILIGSHVI